MINIGDSVYTTLNYGGGQSTGKVCYSAENFEFIPNAMDNLTKGLSAKSKRQNCSFDYQDVTFMKKGGFLFFKVITMKIKTEDGTIERLGLFTRRMDEVYDFLKTKVPTGSIR